MRDLIFEVFFPGCACFGVWHFGRATYIAFKFHYIMWSNSPSSDGHRVYKSVNRRRYWIGTWTNLFGLALMVLSLGVFIHGIVDHHLRTSGWH